MKTAVGIFLAGLVFIAMFFLSSSFRNEVKTSVKGTTEAIEKIEAPTIPYWNQKSEVPVAKPVEVAEAPKLEPIPLPEPIEVKPEPRPLPALKPLPRPTATAKPRPFPSLNLRPKPVAKPKPVVKPKAVAKPRPVVRKKKNGNPSCYRRDCLGFCYTRGRVYEEDGNSGFEGMGFVKVF